MKVGLNLISQQFSLDNKQKNTCSKPYLKSLQQDSVSFCANEKKFLQYLNEFVGSRYNGEKSGRLRACAQDVNPLDEDVMKALNEAIANETNEGKKKTLLRAKTSIEERR